MQRDGEKGETGPGQTSVWTRVHGPHAGDRVDIGQRLGRAFHLPLPQYQSTPGSKGVALRSGGEERAESLVSVDASSKKEVCQSAQHKFKTFMVDLY